LYEFSEYFRSLMNFRNFFRNFKVIGIFEEFGEICGIKAFSYISGTFYLGISMNFRNFKEFSRIFRSV
jgi:hypothetical protein